MLTSTKSDNPNSGKKRSSDPVVKTRAMNSTDEAYDSPLRPSRLGEFIGQTSLKKNLQVFIDAAKKRKEPLEHVLFYGPPGLGKTTLASILSKEIGSELRVTSGPALEKQGDVAAILSHLQKNDVLFIDEIHRLRPQVEELLYAAMEDFALDIVVGSGPGAKTMRLALPPFTLIGATTRASSLSAPLRDRFGHVVKIEFYNEQELTDIIIRSASVLNIQIQQDAAVEIAKRSRKTPRIANRLLKRVRDFSDVLGDGIITKKIASEALKSLGIDNYGLDDFDRNILLSIYNDFHGGPVGLNTLAATLGEEEATISDVSEPFLLQMGFIKRFPRGRVITEKGKQHIADIKQLF
jgi:holliday junction DNA helicase RuvB